MTQLLLWEKMTFSQATMKLLPYLVVQYHYIYNTPKMTSISVINNIRILIMTIHGICQQISRDMNQGKFFFI